MSDFLGHLVARTIAQPSLRPRTRSRFESPTIEEAPLVWPETTTAAEPQVVTQTPTPSTPAQTTAPQADRRRPAGWVSGVSPLTGGRRDDAAPAGEDAGGPDPSKSAEPETRVVIEHDVQRIVETNERVVPIAARPHRFDEQPPRIIERRGSREIEERQHERVIHTATDRIHRIAGKAQSIESAAAPEPVIQVSIGRIEVRAVTPASPARSAQRGAAMTIDDYVAKRKAKERR